MTKEILNRKDAPKESTWNAESVFASWDDWQAELDNLVAELPKLSEFAGKLGSRPSVLADWFDTFFSHLQRMIKLHFYAILSATVDANDMTAKGKMGQANDMWGKFSTTVAFAEPEMLDLGAALLEWTETEPRLGVYKHYAHNLLRQKAHTRSAEGGLGDVIRSLQRGRSDGQRTD